MITNAPFTLGLRCVYGASRLSNFLFPCGDGHSLTIIVRIHGLRSLYDFVNKKVIHVLKIHKPVARTYFVAVITRSPHGHHTESALYTCRQRTVFGGNVAKQI